MRAIIPFALLFLVGCQTQKQPQLGMGDVHVPGVFHPSLNWVDRAPSHYERYLEMFRDGYWDCVTKYHDDINYAFEKPDSYACGWMSEVAGYSDGYVAAERDMRKNIKQFGKERTSKYLREIWDGG